MLNKYLKISLFLFSILYFVNFDFVSAATISKTPSTPPALKAGLVGWWTMDSADVTSAAAIDKSVSQNNGTRTNTKVATGKIGQSMDFTGTNSFLSLSSIALTDNFTISYWSKTPSYAYAPGSTGGMVFGGETAAKGYVWEQNNTEFQISNDGETKNFRPVYQQSADYNWKHITVAVNNAQVSLYKNGIFVSSTQFASPFTISATRIGMSYAAAYNYKGQIDDVRAYNRALSAREIQQLYQMGGTKIAKTPTVPPTLKTGLVGHWTMDGPDVTTTAAIDRSGSGNNGTRNNGVLMSNGKIGQSAKFDGINDAISIGDIELATEKTLTISSWFKLKSLTEYESIVAKNFATWSYAMQGDTTTGILRFWVSSDSYAQDAESNVNVADNKWHHAVGVYDGNLASANTKLYIDGILQSKTFDQTINIPNTNDPIVIGAISNAGNFSLDGNVDDVRVYSRALSAKEIQQLYQMGGTKIAKTPTVPPTLRTGLVGHWTMDGPDVTSTAAIDRSGSGINGTRSGTTTIATGKIGQAMRFDGSSGILGIASSILRIPNDVTISAWVNLRRLTAGWQSVADFGATGQGTFLGIANTDRFVFYAYTGGWEFATDSVAPTLNQWVHIAGTRKKSGNTILYVNGISKASTPSNGNNITYTINNEKIGGTTGYDQWLNGSVDDVRVYNRALSTGEIQQLYRMGR